MVSPSDVTLDLLATVNGGEPAKIGTVTIPIRVEASKDGKFILHTS